MNQQELKKMVEELLLTMEPSPHKQEPEVKASGYYPRDPGPQQKDSGFGDGDFVQDVTDLNLRKLYLTEGPREKEKFARMKLKTSARLGSGRAGPRYKTLTALRFRADHAAAQDAVFSEMPKDYGEKNGLPSFQTRCTSKDQYLTRPDLGRCFSEEEAEKIRKAIPTAPTVQIVIGDGLSSAAILSNAMDCCRALEDGLKLKGIPFGKPIFVRYCRVGAGDAVGDITGCQLVCMLVGERPGLTTAESMSAYITFQPRTGVSESSRTVVSNIHAQGTPAVEAGAHIAGLIEKILAKKVSGVGLQLEKSS